MAEKKKREAAPGTRTRREAAMVEVKPVPRPSLESMGTGHVVTDAIIAGGPAQLLASDRRAQVLAKEHGEVFGEEFKAMWTFETVWLQNLKETHRGRVQAEYAMRWRPTFLAVVALSHGVILGCKAADVSPTTVIFHREKDPDFDAQVLAAQDYCIQLLHSVTMRDAVEGVLEPIFWQGIEVGHVKKVDNRLRIEMLRAHMPETFKTPGSKINIGSGNTLIGGNVVTAEAALKLQAMRAQSLETMRQEKLANAREVSPVEVPQLLPES